MRLGRGHGGVAARARVAKGVAGAPRGLSERVERLGRAAAPVGPALGEEALGMGAVDLGALRLPIAGRGRPLVPVEPEPPHRVDDLADVLLGGARAVGVLDPQDEDAAVVAGEGPVEERGPGAADVKVAGGARGKADANGLGHRRCILRRSEGYAGQKVRRRISARGRLRMTSMIRRQTGGRVDGRTPARPSPAARSGRPRPALPRTAARGGPRSSPS